MRLLLRLSSRLCGQDDFVLHLQSFAHEQLNRLIRAGRQAGQLHAQLRDASLQLLLKGSAARTEKALHSEE